LIFDFLLTSGVDGEMDYALVLTAGNNENGPSYTLSSETVRLFWWGNTVWDQYYILPDIGVRRQ